MFVADVDYEKLHKHYPLLDPPTIAGDCTPNYIYCEPVAERILDIQLKIKLLITLLADAPCRVGSRMLYCLRVGLALKQSYHASPVECRRVITA
jgi:hypothetical protein